ncbi:MAG: arginine--tRNA ligase [Lachnospiraceae bacterium]|nr:arginine--tRNA ligase [Lachnospiraceae bacterium]
MINMIYNAMSQIKDILTRSYKELAAEGVFIDSDELPMNVEIPADTGNGDFASSFALTAARTLHKAPRMIADAVAERADLSGSYFTRIEVAGPGFINFFVDNSWYVDVLNGIEKEQDKYGSSNKGEGRKINVEFVSANPTGPMHIGNARGGVLGDTLANLLKKSGYEVSKEFYVNDAGNQVHKFAVSINGRYMQLIYGEDGFEFPEDCYQGDDIKELAQALYDEHGKDLLDMEEDARLDLMADFGLKRNIPQMKIDLEKYRVTYDTWFLESTLHESGLVADTVQKLTDKGLTYEKDGALWLKTTELLVDKYTKEGKTPEQIENLNLKDDVLKRSNGFYTYFAADIAYHRNKFDRGFTKAINIWGADHFGHVARLQAALDGLGLDGSNKLVIVLMHLVNLVRDGEPVRMSKRSGKAIALRDLLDEISIDAARYFFNSRSAASAIDFDLDLAVKNDSDNPVYYIQYAYARINSLVNNVCSEEEKSNMDFVSVDTTMLTEETELNLIKCLARFPEVMNTAAEELDPSHINRYLLEVAGEFHRFYTANRIKGEEEALRNARLKMVDCTRIVLKCGMSILGLDLPERM